MRNLVLRKPEVRVTDDVTSSLSYAWNSIKLPLIVPLLRLAMILCSVMSVMLFVERLYMATVILFVKLLRKKRYTKYKLDSMREAPELTKSYPMVLVQIPMYNEKEVCSIAWTSLNSAAHHLHWLLYLVSNTMTWITVFVLTFELPSILIPELNLIWFKLNCTVFLPKIPFLPQTRIETFYTINYIKI